MWTWVSFFWYNRAAFRTRKLAVKGRAYLKQPSDSIMRVVMVAWRFYFSNEHNHYKSQTLQRSICSQKLQKMYFQRNITAIKTSDLKRKLGILFSKGTNCMMCGIGFRRARSLVFEGARRSSPWSNPYYMERTCWCLFGNWKHQINRRSETTTNTRLWQLFK